MDRWSSTDWADSSFKTANPPRPERSPMLDIEPIDSANVCRRSPTPTNWPSYHPREV